MENEEKYKNMVILFTKKLDDIKSVLNKNINVVEKLDNKNIYTPSGKKVNTLIKSKKEKFYIGNYEGEVNDIDFINSMLKSVNININITLSGKQIFNVI